MIAEVFKLLEQKRCDEIFNSPTPFFNSVVEDNFLKSYACILCKDSEVAVSYRNVLADFLSKTQSEILSKEHKLEAEAACLFLDAHILRLRMNFLGARELIIKGLNMASEAGCHELVFRFMFLQCWMYRYCYHRDLALVYVERMEKYANSNSLLTPFHTGLCKGLRLFIEHHSDDLNDLDMRAAYFVHEFSGGWLRPEGWSRSSASDYFRPIFGDSSCESVYDRAIGEISFSASGFDVIREYYDKLTDNQRLICNFRIGRDINLNTLNPDSFLIEPQNLANYLVKTQLSDEHKTLLIEKFNTFLQEAFFQLNLEVYRPFVSEWFAQYRDSGIETFCKYLGSRDIYDDITDAEMQSGPWTRDHAMRRVMDNMSMILDMSSQDGSKVTLPILTELIVRIILYRYNYYKNDTEIDNFNISRIASLIQSNEFDSFEHESNDVNMVYPYNLRSFPEAYRAVVNDERRLSDSVVISAVLLEQYVFKSQVIKNLCAFWGDDGLKFNDKLKEKLQTAFSIVADQEIDWIDESNGIGCIHGKERDIYIALFSEVGEWDAQYDGNVFLHWRCEASKKRVPSPVSIIMDHMNDERESIGFVVLMPGCYLVNSGPVEDSLKADISIISYNRLYNSFQLYFSDKPKSEILSTASDEGIVKDSSGYNWDLFKIRRRIGDKTLVLRDHNPYDKLGLMYIIHEFAKRSKIESCNIVYRAEIKNSSYFVEITGAIQHSTFTPHTLRFFTQSSFGRNLITDQPEIVVVEDSEKIMVHTMQFSNHEDKLDYRELRKELAYVLQEEDVVFGLRNIDENQQVKFEQSLVLYFAEKTAKTAIMARNMSHNLGSHVMFYIKQQLSSVNEMLRTKVFDQLFSDENDLLMLLSNPQEWLDNKYKGKEKEVPNIDNVALPFLVGLGRFMSYIQERQDFIASVATNFIPPASSLNFKDFIYDELNPDKRYMRHPDRLGDKPLNILLSYIARSENLGRQSTAASDWSGASQENDIVIKFGDFDGDPVDEIRSAGYNPVSHYGNREAVEKASASLEQMRKLDFSIPSGVTGRHAFFSIIENLIRNSAKHGKFDNSIDRGSLKLTLNVYDKQSIRTAPDNDNCPSELSLKEVFERFYLKASDSDELYYVTVTDNLPSNLSTVQCIRKAIMEPYVNKKGRMNENFKGIKEMRICASWLRSSFSEQYPFPRKMDDTDYIKDEHGFPFADSKWKEINIGKAPTLYVRISNGHLQYIFAVQRPLKVLIISNRFDPTYYMFKDYDKLNNDVLRPNGWLGMSTSDYLSCEKRPDYEFVLWDMLSDDDAVFNEIRSKSNRRTYRIVDVDGLGDKFTLDILNADSDRLSSFYEMILRHMSSYQEGDWILIDDKKAEDHFNATQMDNPVDLKNLVRFTNSGTEAPRFGYRTHFDTESPETFDNFFHSNSAVEYREGVTGANSTDRLVRCDEINLAWFYRHLNIMKKSVAIFDERISDKVFSLSGVKPDDEGRLLCRDHRPYVLSLKKIFVFNVMKENDGIYIYGLLTDDIYWDFNNDTLHSYCVKIAKITEEQDSYVVKPLGDKEPYKHAFDLLTIHQGILDKLYEWFGIKHQTSKIELLTKAMYEAFCKGKAAALPSDKIHFLLPGMSIHSGRSLPSADDMPQHLPFIQFASLESAFNDCKYSLVELMEHAYYDRK